MKKEKRFEIIDGEVLGITKEATVLRDNETGVLYLFYQTGYGGGLTPLIDKNGKPLIDEPTK